MNEPNPNVPPNPYANAPVHPPVYTAGGSRGEDATGGVIPYNNPKALIAYYLGLFSLFPCLGLALAIPAFVLGIMGLQARKRNPAIRGSVHAWIGIIMGGMMTVVWGLVGMLVLIAMVGSRAQ